MLSVRENIPSKLLSTENAPIEGFWIEVNFRRKKWLLCVSYNPHSNAIDSHVGSLTRSLALYSSIYDNHIVVGNFIVEVDDAAVSDFSNMFDLVSLIKEPTFYKHPEKLSCIDLILTNKSHSFQNSCVIETGLSDFHRMILTATKMTFQKLRLRLLNNRDYINLSIIKIIEKT